MNSISVLKFAGWALVGATTVTFVWRLGFLSGFQGVAATLGGVAIVIPLVLALLSAIALRSLGQASPTPDNLKAQQLAQRILIVSGIALVVIGVGTAFAFV